MVDRAACFRIHHPFLLSDNRHYTFYVWRRIFLAHPMVPYLLIPVYLACAWAWFLRVGASSLPTAFLIGEYLTEGWQGEIRLYCKTCFFQCSWSLRFCRPHCWSHATFSFPTCCCDRKLATFLRGRFYWRACGMQWSMLGLCTPFCIYLERPLDGLCGEAEQRTLECKQRPNNTVRWSKLESGLVPFQQTPFSATTLFSRLRPHFTNLTVHYDISPCQTLSVRVAAPTPTPNPPNLPPGAPPSASP